MRVVGDLVCERVVLSGMGFFRRWGRWCHRCCCVFCLRGSCCRTLFNNIILLLSKQASMVYIFVFLEINFIKSIIDKGDGS